MHMLARNWQRIGVLRRSDQIYEQVFAFMNQDPAHRRAGPSLLREWIPLKVTLGETEQAKELAAQQSAIDMELYNCGKIPKQALEHSLAFHVKTLKDLNDIAGARAAQERADSLRDLPVRCDGACVSEPTLPACD
jgi:hypothetical protein